MAEQLVMAVDRLPLHSPPIPRLAESYLITLSSDFCGKFRRALRNIDPVLGALYSRIISSALSQPAAFLRGRNTKGTWLLPGERRRNGARRTGNLAP